MKKSFKNKLISNFITLGIHLGYFSKNKRDKRLNKFLVGTRGFFELFHINRTLVYFLKFLNFYLYFVEYKPFFLFTTTFHDLSNLVYEFVSKTKHSCFTEVWIGGILTNGLIGQYDLICRESFIFQKFRLNNFPNLVFVLNLNEDNKKLLSEANNTNIPVVTFVDSYNSLDNFEYMVIGNNDSTEVMAFYFYLLFIFSNLVNSFNIENGNKYRFFVNYYRLLGSNFKKINENSYKRYLLSLRLYLRYNYQFWSYRKNNHQPFLESFREEESLSVITKKDRVDFYKKFLVINVFLTKHLLQTRKAKSYKPLANFKKTSGHRPLYSNSVTKICFYTYASFCFPAMFFVKSWFSFYMSKVANFVFYNLSVKSGKGFPVANGNFSYFLKNYNVVKSFRSKPLFLSRYGQPFLNVGFSKSYKLRKKFSINNPNLVNLASKFSFLASLLKNNFFDDKKS